MRSIPVCRPADADCEPDNMAWVFSEELCTDLAPEVTLAMTDEICPLNDRFCITALNQTALESFSQQTIYRNTAYDNRYFRHLFPFD